MSLKKRYLILLLLTGLIIGFLSTFAFAEEEISVSGISLDQTELRLILGHGHGIKATVYPANATNKSIEWLNSDPDVITLEVNGNEAYIISLKPGEALITAETRDGGFTETCKVIVFIPVTSIGIDQESVNLAPGENAELKAWVIPRNASDQGIIWESSDYAIANVDDEGEVKAVRDGETRIIARAAEDRSISTYVTINVSAGQVIMTPDIDSQPDEPTVTEDNGMIGNEEPQSYLLYALIAASVIALVLLIILITRRRGKQVSVQQQPTPLSGASVRLPVLKGISGLYTGSKFALNTGPVTIGRDQSAARVAYPQEYDQISRRHITVHFDPVAENFMVEDFSSNGTYLSDGNRLQSNQILQPGETLTLSNTEETFVVELE